MITSQSIAGEVLWITSLVFLCRLIAYSCRKTALLDQLNELALNSKMARGPNPIAVLNLVDIVAKDLQKKETPEAYLIYALYDEDSNRYEVEDRA